MNDLNRTKWDSRSTIYNEIIKSFAAWEKKFIGPIEAYMKDPKTVVIIGEKLGDHNLFFQKKWTNTVFDGIKFNINIDILTPDIPELMLMGTTRTNISPKGEAELKKSYNISRILVKGTNKYELKFGDTKSRNLAMELGFIATAGVKIKVSEWRKVLDVSQCNKCLKYGHYRAECKSHYAIGNCRYCAVTDSRHESVNCSVVHIYEAHKCLNCISKKGYKTHNAGEKSKCEFFMEYYFSKCKVFQIEPEEKYKELFSKIKERDGLLNNNNNINNWAVSEARMKAEINRKTLQQMNLNRKLFGEDIQNYTAVCDEILDESVMNLYRETKAADEDGSESVGEDEE